MSDDTTVLRCSVDHCGHGIRVPVDHLNNLQAAGWTCPGPHDKEPTPPKGNEPMTGMSMTIDLGRFDDTALRQMCALAHNIASGALAGSRTGDLALEIAAALDEARTRREQTMRDLADVIDDALGGA